MKSWGGAVRFLVRHDSPRSGSPSDEIAGRGKDLDGAARIHDTVLEDDVQVMLSTGASL